MNVNQTNLPGIVQDLVKLKEFFSQKENKYLKLSFFEIEEDKLKEQYIVSTDARELIEEIIKMVIHSKKSELIEALNVAEKYLESEKEI